MLCPACCYYSCCKISVSSLLQGGMTKFLQCTDNITTYGYTHLKASRRKKTSRQICKRHFGDVSSSKPMQPLSLQGFSFPSYISSRCWLQTRNKYGRHNCLHQQFVLKSLLSTFYSTNNFPYNHCKENCKRFKCTWLFILHFLDLYLGYQRTQNAAQPDQQRGRFHSARKKYSWILV